MKAKKQTVAMKLEGAKYGFEMPVVVHEDAILGGGNTHLVAEKSPLKSKTIWFNLIALALTVLATFLPMAEQYMSRPVYIAILAVVTFGNKAIRLVTRQPLTGMTRPIIVHEDYYGDYHYQTDKDIDNG